MALRLFLPPLLLLAAALLVTQAQGIGNSASDCCLRHSQKAIPSRVVGSYRLQGPEMGCMLPAVVFITKKNRKICASPNNPSVKKLMESLDKDKNKKEKALPLRSGRRPKKQRRQRV